MILYFDSLALLLFVALDPSIFCSAKNKTILNGKKEIR
jgi:hypothetical protein